MLGLPKNSPPLTALAGCALLTACVTLPPYASVVDSLPSGEFVELAGSRVHVQTFGFEGPGSPLVLVHGYGASSYSWRNVAPRLADKHRVVAVDLVGFGLSERPEDKTKYSRTGQVRVLSALVDHFGWSSAHFAGHSYGGGLIMSLAYVEPDKVRSLTLVGSTAPVYSDKRRHFFGHQPFASLLVRAFLRPALIGRSLRRSFWDDSEVTDDLIQAYLERVRVRGAGRAFAGLTAPARPDERFDGLTYEKLAPPTLAIWGSDDVLIPAAGARKSVARIPNNRFVEIDDCGHTPMEERPDEVVSAMLPFLSSADSESVPKKPS